MPDLTPLEAAEKLEEFIHYPKLGYAKSEDIDLFMVAASYLRKIDTGEYKQVVHAHWVRRDVFGEDPLECSACGNSVSVIGYKICPSCGALMDGKDDSHETGPDD